nr:gustatory receptor 34 [Papilio dardanus]
MNIWKPFKILLVIGNVLFLFRNISFVSKRIRAIMIIAIIVEISISIYNCYIIAYFCLYYHLSDCVNIYMVFWNSLVLIFFSCYYSEKFKKLLISFNEFNSFFIKDEFYSKKNNNRNPILIIFFILFVITKIVLIFVTRKYYNPLRRKFSVFFAVCLRINTLLNDIRYFYEYFLLYAILGIISDQLDCIIRSVDKEIKYNSSYLEKIQVNHIKLSIKTISYEKNVKQWSQIYSGIAESTDKFNDVFGIQMTIMLISAVTYITIFLYTITFLSVHGLYDTSTLIVYIQKTIIMQIQILILSYTAQRINNKVLTLRRRLGALLLDSVNDYNRYRITKDLLRFISYRRLQIKAFGSFSVDMTLPPSCVMLFTSYTVIALQFNNVL